MLLVYIEKQGMDKVKVITDAVLLLQENASSLEQLRPDKVEFAYLKAITLFSPGLFNNSMLSQNLHYLTKYELIV